MHSLGVRPFSWESLWKPDLHPLEVALRAALVYLVVMLVFRLIPRKELARFSPIDIILLTLVTVALRKSIVGDDDSLTAGFVALATIVLINQALHALARRNHWWSDRVQGRRLQLMKDGEIIPGGLRLAKVTEDELLSRLRGYGTDKISRVESAYMERDGKITFVFRDGPH
ncbi:MAG TPA: YetF domain-containing protein [Vulgatibacter sp.]